MNEGSKSGIETQNESDRWFPLFMAGSKELYFTILNIESLRIRSDTRKYRNNNNNSNHNLFSCKLMYIKYGFVLSYLFGCFFRSANHWSRISKVLILPTRSRFCVRNVNKQQAFLFLRWKAAVKRNINCSFFISHAAGS